MSPRVVHAVHSQWVDEGILENMTRTLHAYAYLHRPYDAVRMTFAEELIDVLQHATEAAQARAVSVSTSLRASFGPIEFGAPVQVEMTGFEQSPPGTSHPSCRLHLEWKAERAPAFFPRMTADLVAHPVGFGETQLALFGTYRPPLGLVGDLADAVLGHRLAEASVHRFVQEVVTRLELAIPADYGLDDEVMVGDED